MNRDIFSDWRKSSRSSGTGNCVEVAVAERGASSRDSEAGTRAGRTVGVRDSKDRDGAVLDFTSTAWRAFVADARASIFDLR
ncbi:MAG: hypothetical protein QOE54_2776 [Streptosporangiaceae bacterium]|jgi:hypothetical protein|nr:hypothetical protein [Mycobacterium sp.]MDX6430410.1 hypothetical protein [Streptosporangiaceae bacterium]